MPNRIFYQPVFNIVITGEMYTSYKGIYGLPTAQSSHTNPYCSIYTLCVFLVQFGESSRYISLTFVFRTTVRYGVIIPGNYSDAAGEISRR